MDDATLEELAAQHASLKARIKKLEGQASKLKDKLLDEMDRRKTKGIEFDSGLRITKVTPTTIEYDAVRLKRVLGTKWRLVTSQVLDKDKLAALVQEGEVDAAKVNRCATEKAKASYPLVSNAGG